MFGTSPRYEDLNWDGLERFDRSRYEEIARVLGIELLCAAEALEHRRPLRSSRAVEAVHAAIRARVAGTSARSATHAPLVPAAHTTCTTSPRPGAPSTASRGVITVDIWASGGAATGFT